MLDFSELLQRCYELLRDHPSLLEHYQERFQSIHVSEFQDINTIQYKWLYLLTGTQGKLFVVFDDDQSMYAWRGAKLKNIQQIQADFSETHLVRLEQNYRSTGTILAAANALIAHNKERLGKKLWTTQDKALYFLLMTRHAAKGLEFEHVFFMWFGKRIISRSHSPCNL